MRSGRSWVLQIDPAVYKILKKMPRQEARRVFGVIENELAFNPYSGDVQKMGGEKNVWRRRIGSHRVFYEVHQTKRAVHVFHVTRRTSATY